MPSVQDVFDQLVAANANLIKVHNDLVAEADATHGVQTSVNASNATLNAGFTVLSQDLGALAALQAQLVTVLNEVYRQQGTMICSLDQIARNSCALLNESHEQTAFQSALLDAIDELRDMYKTVHPEAALEIERRLQIRRQLQACCPPQPSEPVCTHETCSKPEPIELPSPDPTVPLFPSSHR